MCIALLRGKNAQLDIISQQHCIIKYAKYTGLKLDQTKIDQTKIDNSQDDRVLEDRKEFKRFLRSLKQGANLIVFDLCMLSEDMSKLLKIFDFLFGKSINLTCKHKNATLESK
ncbi:MAG: recombinase family protein [Sulfurospirillum sp.]|nr:recombinase family protein [Sulfurospirillum sp.]